MKRRKVLTLNEDDLTDICCHIVNELVGAGLIMDCTGLDTEFENEFEAQEIIFSILIKHTHTNAKESKLG